MSFLLTALASLPQALYLLDDTTPFTEYSGYNRVGTSSAANTRHPALVKGAGYSQAFASTVVGSFASPVFTQGKESDAFTLEVWLYPGIVANEYQQVLGNLNQMDGLVIYGTTLSFVTKYLDATEARASFDLQQQRRVHVVGVHTKEKNSLYINGVLVDEVAITDTQAASGYVATSANLTSGTSVSTAGTQRTFLNGVTVYSYALPHSAILNNYNSGVITDDVPTQFGGDTIPLAYDDFDVFLEELWDTNEDWNAAELRNVVAVDNMLTPQFSGDVSIPGQWLDSFALHAANSTSIYGLTISWEGRGVVVEASNNGTSWETVVNGRRSTTVTVGYNPTDKQIQLRVSFPGGITNDDSYIKNLHVVGLSTAVSKRVAGRTVTLVNSMPQYDRVPQEYWADWGTWLNTTSYTLTVSADTIESTPLRTVEVWIKRTGSTLPTITGPTGTTYINGVASGSSFLTGNWTLYHIVTAADYTGDIVITGPGQVGHVAVYETAFSATEIAAIAAAYFGTNVTRVSDTSVVTITEPATSASIYAHDWTIQGAG